MFAQIKCRCFYLEFLLSSGSSTSMLIFVFSKTRIAVIISLVFISLFHVCISITIIQFIGRCPSLFSNMFLPIVIYNSSKALKSFIRNLSTLLFLAPSYLTAACFPLAPPLFIRNQWKKLNKLDHVFIF